MGPTARYCEVIAGTWCVCSCSFCLLWAVCFSWQAPRCGAFCPPAICCVSSSSLSARPAHSINPFWMGNWWGSWCSCTRAEHCDWCPEEIGLSWGQLTVPHLHTDLPAGQRSPHWAAPSSVSSANHGPQSGNDRRLHPDDLFGELASLAQLGWSGPQS